MKKKKKIYSIREPRKKLLFESLGWRKEGPRLAGRRKRDPVKERDGEQRETSAGTNNKRGQVWKSKDQGWAEKKIEEQWEEKWSDREELHHIHHEVFKWLRVVICADGRQIHHTQKSYWSEDRTDTRLGRVFADSDFWTGVTLTLLWTWH